MGYWTSEAHDHRHFQAKSLNTLSVPRALTAVFVTEAAGYRESP